MLFFEELKRRNVVRIGVAYLVAAWLLIQISDVLTPIVPLPTWVPRIVFVIFAIGFIPALVLAWAYEYTPKGIMRDKEASELGDAVPLTSHQKTIWLIGVSLGALLAVILTFNVGGLRERLIYIPESGPIASVAVLPLDNLSGDPEQEYFADGMTETLITELAKIGALRVPSRLSVMQFKDKVVSMQDIARELNVDAIVEGSALLIDEDVRITVQLIEAATDQHLWAESYDRDLSNVLALHGEVARSIAREIQFALTPEDDARLADVREVDPAAYNHWLKGNFHFDDQGDEALRKAVASYQAAIDRDSSFAAAYAGLAFAYTMLGSWNGTEAPSDVSPLARTAAQRALELDPTLATAHTALGTIRRFFDWDWDGAEQAYKQAMTLSPKDTWPHHFYTNFLTSLGRFEESINISWQALELNSLAPTHYMELSLAHRVAGSYEEALDLGRNALDVDPNLWIAQWNLHMFSSDRFIEIGDFDKALEHLAQAEKLVKHPPPFYIGWYGRAYALIGHQAVARNLLSQLMGLREQGYVPGSALAVIYVGLGEKEEALRWLEIAFEERDVYLIWLKVMDHFDPLRSDQRFQDLLDRMKFPDT